MILQKMRSSNSIQPPRWLVDNTMYLTIMGSMAYGVSSDNSDNDYYGFCVPPKDIVFPHLAGQIQGFGTQIQRFDQWQQHHVKDPDGKDIIHDFSVYNIVRYFQLCMENNPNMLDSLFTPRRCIIHITPMAELVRENRKMFLHKGAWHKFKGYAYSQMHKIKGKVNASNPKRAEQIANFGYDVKFAYHIVRLLNEVEQIMVEGDLDIERNREQLKSIRRGEWPLEQIESYFSDKEKLLEKTYAESKLQHSPDEAKIKQLLFNCLETHFGSLQGAVNKDVLVTTLISELQSVISRYEGK